jgi:hypothetical protein
MITRYGERAKIFEIWARKALEKTRPGKLKFKMPDLQAVAPLERRHRAKNCQTGQSSLS